MHTLILSFPYSSAMGGGERYLEQLVAGLKRRGREFTLVSSSRAMLEVFRRRSWDNRPLWGGIEPVSELSVVLFPLTLPFFLPIMLVVLAIFRFRRGTKDVICLSLTEKLLATLPARLLGQRVIWVEHLVPGRSLLLNPYRPFYVWLSRFVRIVAVSEAVVDSLASIGVSRARMTVAYPGIVAEEVAACRPADLPTVGAVSRLSAEKNVGLLIRAFARVLKEVPETRLSIFGEGAERQELEALAEKLGVAPRVTFHGFVPGKQNIYGGMRLLAVPSSRESFGIAALEAMSCGLPVAATDVGGLPEVIKDGETGLLVKPDDEEALAGAILKILTDRSLAERLGAGGRARAAVAFNLEKTLSIWEQVLNRRHAHAASS